MENWISWITSDLQNFSGFSQAFEHPLDWERNILEALKEMGTKANRPELIGYFFFNTHNNGKILIVVAPPLSICQNFTNKYYKQWHKLMHGDGLDGIKTKTNKRGDDIIFYSYYDYLLIARTLCINEIKDVKLTIIMAIMN